MRKQKLEALDWSNTKNSSLKEAFSTTWQYTKIWCCENLLFKQAFDFLWIFFAFLFFHKMRSWKNRFNIKSCLLIYSRINIVFQFLFANETQHGKVANRVVFWKLEIEFLLCANSELHCLRTSIKSHLWYPTVIKMQLLHMAPTKGTQMALDWCSHQPITDQLKRFTNSNLGTNKTIARLGHSRLNAYALRGGWFRWFGSAVADKVLFFSLQMGPPALT